MSDVEDRISEMMRQDATPSKDQLAKIRDAIAEYRDLDAEAKDLDQRLAEKKSKKLEIERTLLPWLFSEVGVDEVSIPASGNLPAAEAKLLDRYYANVAADWSPANRDRGFSVLDRLGIGDVVKTIVSVEFGRGESARAEELVAHLRSLGHRPVATKSAHWKALTSALRELCQQGRRPSPEDLNAIGGSVGKAVAIKFKSKD